MVLFVSDLNLAGIPLVKTSFNNEKSIKMSQITSDVCIVAKIKEINAETSDLCPSIMCTSKRENGNPFALSV